MTTSAVASGPIPIFTSTGQQQFVPLSALSFDGSGVLQVTGAYSGALGWLRYLASIGLITPGTAPASLPAMVIRAAAPGSWANQIKVNVAYTNATTYDLTVTATNRYELTTATIASVLGTQTITGSSPGLVRIKDADIVAGVVGMPAALAAVALGATFTKAVPAQSAGTAFNLDAVTGSGQGANIKVAVTPGAGTSFRLDVTLTVTASSITSASTASTINSAVGYLVTVAAPPGSASLGMPKANTIFLTGGVDVATASASPQT